MKITSRKILFLLAFFVSLSAWSQDKFKFTVEKELKATSVKNQGYTGTCWSFATCSLLESELLRMGKEEADLSEMYFVRCTYIEKAKMYIRLHGLCNYGEGGEAHDVINVMKIYGAVPQKIYEGKKENEKIYDHSQMEPELKAYLDKLLKENTSNFPQDWQKGYEKILDKYMGKVPESFEYNDKKYTPMTFMTDFLGLNPDDYIEFTSFSHHPYNTEFFLEIPDNWSFDLYRNVKLDEIIEIIDTSIAKGYTVGWGGDVSEEEFSSTEGIAIVPEKSWEHKSDAEKERTDVVPEKELKVTQELHQKGFDNFTTTDDHFMHITGIAKDLSGNKYYMAKNSWGKKGSKDGYVYLSEQYVKMKLISIIVNKNAVQASILGNFSK